MRIGGIGYVLLSFLWLILSFCSSDQPQVFKRMPSSRTGISFNNHIVEDDQYNVQQYMNIYTGAGVAVGDINNDGLTDLYFSGNMVSGQLYLNGGNLEFEDITKISGLENHSWGTGAVMVDIDQDGWMDIYVCVSGGAPEEERRNLLYINNGDNTFNERARAYNIDDTRQTMHASFLDFDKDGDLDLFLLINQAAYEHQVNVIRIKDINDETISADVLYRNNGDGTFTDVSAQAGIVVDGYGLGVAISDINQDGWPDIYISNDFIGSDVLYINNMDGTFSDQAANYFKHTSYAGMGNDIADFNNDGLVDIIVLDMRPEDNLRQKLIITSRSYDQFQRLLTSGYQPQYSRNTLQLNRGYGRFSEIGFLSGISSTDWSWSALLADYDNDGDRDLFVTNGFLRDLGNLDYIHHQSVYNNPFGKVEIKLENKRMAIKSLPGAALRDYLFENNGDLTFTDRSLEWGIDHPGYSHGAVYVDLDNDGDLELVINNVNEEAHVYENRTSQLLNRNYIQVTLEGNRPNLNGIGAKLWIKTDNSTQYYEHYLYRGYESSVDPIIHFGLDSVRIIDRLEIEWPDGKYQVLKNVTANQLLKLSYRQASHRPPVQPTISLVPMLEEVTDTLNIYYEHQEDHYVDFKAQPLIPHQHSKGGPGIAIGEVNSDGLDDFYVGGASGYPGYLYLQQTSGLFEAKPFNKDSGAEDMGSLFFDADLDGDLDLYIVSGGSSLPSGSEKYQDRLYLNDGMGNFTKSEAALPVISASGSSVIAGDYDRDGDLDLFIGGRIVPQEYPMPARSYILRNETLPGNQGNTKEEIFTDVTDEVAPELSLTGLVTSALWTDYDNDGWLDLIVVGEFMPIRFYHNQKGIFTDTESSGLSNSSGWWNSLASGDFDEDGDIDYLAGNLGLNSRYQAGPMEPLSIYANDYDNNGRIDPVMCYFIQGENYIAHSRDDIISQINAMQTRFRTYKDYAQVTFDESFLPSELSSAYVVQSNTFKSSYIENLGDGKFSIRALPIEAQFAPVYGMTAMDYNQDGHLDVLLVGNSYATEVTTGRYDASIGVYLEGDGQGGLLPVSNQKSGFFVDGDAKGLGKLLSRDGSVLTIATTNSGRLKVFRQTEPGQKNYRIGPNDVYATVTLKNGKTYKEEFHYGSTYLSQSSRFLNITQDVEQISITDFKGRTRLLEPK